MKSTPTIHSLPGIKRGKAGSGIYAQEQTTHVCYDLVKRLKTTKQGLPDELDQINDVKYMLDQNTLYSVR